MISDSPTGKELRALAIVLEKQVRKAPCYSVALPIVQNAVDHLRAVARVHDENQRAARRDIQTESERYYCGDPD